MDWLAKMNSAIEYIETHLTDELDYSAIAQKACCSSYNFQRMFSFITEISLSEYIRRRRLTLAALELQNSDVKIIDLAVKYSYDSSTSFSRAFQSLHGVTPSLARNEGTTLKAFPRISFQIYIKGDAGMNYRIENKEAFQVFGIEGIFNTDESGDIPRTPAELWQQCHSNGEFERLVSNSGDLPQFVSPDLCKVHAVCSYKQTEGETFPYMVCSFKSGNSVTEGYTVADIPAHTWAIFPSEKYKWEDFDDVIGNLYKRFFTEWLPTAEYEQVNGIDFEVYGDSNGLGYLELWFAVRKK